MSKKTKRVYKECDIFSLICKKLISKEKALEMFNIPKKKQCFWIYLNLFETDVINKKQFLSYIKNITIDDREYIQLYEKGLVSKEELLKCLGIN